VKRLALELYLEGLGFRSIGRIVKFSNVTILNWIREFGAQLEPIRRDAPVVVMELDEMHSYIGSKKTHAGSGWLLIELQGDSSTAFWVPAIPAQVKSSGKL
jgi:transposase